MNQRINSSIANQVTVDLLGHREMHVHRASVPVVAPSRVPVRLDGNLRGIGRESTPHLFSVKSFTKHGSVGVLPFIPHAFFASRAISVALGLSRCKFSLPHYRLHPFPLLFPLFVIRDFRALLLVVWISVAAFLGGVGKGRETED